MAKAGSKNTAASQQAKCRSPTGQIIVLTEARYLDVGELGGRSDFELLASRRERKGRAYDRINTRYDKTPLKERAWDKVLEIADEYARLPGTTTIDDEKHNSIVDRLYRAIYQGEFKDGKGRMRVAYLDPSPLASIRLDLNNGISLNDFRKLFKIEYLLVRRKECIEWFSRNNIDFPKTFLPSGLTGSDVPNARKLASTPPASHHGPPPVEEYWEVVDQPPHRRRERRRAWTVLRQIWPERGPPRSLTNQQIADRLTLAARNNQSAAGGFSPSTVKRLLKL